MTSASASQSDPTRQQIVVGFDGSASAKGAVRYAIGLAQVLHADVKLITVWTYPIDFSGYPLSGWSQKEEATELVQAITVELFGNDPPEWFTAKALEGNTSRVLIAESAGAVMLVVGSRGHGGFAGLLLGSVSTECSAHATCPVLIVRDDVATAKLFENTHTAGLRA